MLLLLTLTSHIFVQQPTEKGHYIVCFDLSKDLIKIVEYHLSI